MYAIKVDEADIAAIDTLCQEDEYFEGPCAACPACQAGTPHGFVSMPNWANTLISLICVSLIYVFFRANLFWPAIISCAIVLIVAWHVIFPRYRTKKEREMRRLMHAELDLRLTQQQRRARKVNQMAGMVFPRFLGPQGYLALIETELDYFMQRIQAIQYQMRMDYAPNDDLQGLLGAMARLGQRRKQLREYRSLTDSQLRQIKRDAEVLEEALQDSPDGPFAEGQPSQYAYLLIYGHLKFYEALTWGALDEEAIKGLAQRCLAASPPDIMTFEQTIDRCLQRLPQRFKALPYPDPAN